MVLNMHEHESQYRDGREREEPLEIIGMGGLGKKISTRKFS